VTTSAASPSPLSLGHLTVELRTDPLGIDVALPRFAWRLLGEAPVACQTAYRLQARDLDDPAASWDAPTWDTGRVPSSESTHVLYDGPRLLSRQRLEWRVQAWDADQAPIDWSRPAAFEMGLLSAADWTGRWIGLPPSDFISEPSELTTPVPSPLLRRPFHLPAAPSRARLYVTALGLYQACLNGARVGQEWLTPGWTDFHRRVQYQTYDVTGLVRAGENVLALRLGDGWYAGYLAGFGLRCYGDRPAARCQLEVLLPDGQTVSVASDERWTACASGTWLHDVLMGERTDLRVDPVGWDMAGFDDGDWSPVALRADPGVRLVAARDDGVRVIEELAPIAVREIGPKRHLVDFGANVAGVVQLCGTYQAGQHISIRHAEALDAEGALYTDNLRGAQQRDDITTHGAPATLRPRFTYHGFRYAEVAGLEGRLDPRDVSAHVLSSAHRTVGSFTCSDPLVNVLQANIVRSLRGNYLSVPTDCPQRDERLGWAADVQIFAPTAMFNADVANVLAKWLDDLVDAQLASGAYPDLAPRVPGPTGAGNAGWADAGVIVPWVLYQRTGDRQILERLYESMRRYVAFLEADQTAGLRFAGRYGDWVAAGARTDKVLIGTAYLAHIADLFARIADTLGRQADATRYTRLADTVRQAFVQRFVADDGHLASETQTAYAMALGFALVPADLTEAAARGLARLVERVDVHLDTGFLGTPLVLPALSDNGFHEMACRLVRQDTYPSWLFQVRHGATSIWERWNGWTPEAGFASPEMNSLNHCAFGAVGDWLYRYLAGLDVAEPGYRRTLLRPRPGGGFTSAHATHESLYGLHACGWQIQGARLRVEVRVPANTTACIVMPCRGPEGVVLDGRPLAGYDGPYGMAREGLRIDVPPGHFVVEAPY
jgi:alpha-L-rhamnosidase